MVGCMTESSHTTAAEKGLPMKYKMGAVCAAAMLLLTGCVRDGNTDLAERYPSYFKYCFGDDAKCEFVTIEDDLYHNYTISYTAESGVQYSTDLSLIPYDPDKAEDYETAQAYYDAYLETLVMEELQTVFRDDLVSQLLTKHFDGINTENGIRIGEEAECTILPLCNVWSRNTLGINDSDALGSRLCAAHLTPVTGWRVCDAGWTTLAADPQWYLTVSMTISAEADAADYISRMQAAYEEYCAATDEPLSCTFLLRQSDANILSRSELLWRETMLVGEKIDIDTKTAEQADFSIWKEMEKRLREIYAEV